ncbi:chemotaxis protein CheD [Baekduia sp. Peel2402]|uniref:chemotaxis protein CheD n=1 Tax=Baekduia sp. Peel2402 TaxID=3458296 RepID=UPI00403E723E
METVVRMGEASASSIAGDTLACIGLGSCIGLALVDRAKGVAALAHVMLPESSQPDPPQPHKFADLAVPALIDMIIAKGASRIRLEACLVGGAAMFQFGGSGQDIGQRNGQAVTKLLGEHRIPVRATATGGSKGRTIRVAVGNEISITVREAGGSEEHLLGNVTAGKAALVA